MGSILGYPNLGKLPYWGYVGITERKMGSTIERLGFRVYLFEFVNPKHPAGFRFGGGFNGVAESPFISFDPKAFTLQFSQKLNDLRIWNYPKKDCNGRVQVT